MHFLHKNNSRLLLFSLLGVATGLTSCVMDSFEDLSEESERKMLTRGEYYVAFEFDTGDGSATRASNGDIVDGSHQEHDIGAEGNYVIYFNEDDEVVEVTELYGEHVEHPQDYVEGRYISRFNVDAEFEVPHACLVVLNAEKFNGNFFGDCIGKKKEDVMKQVWSSSDPKTIGRDGERFTMTNSIYFDGTGKVIDVVELPEGVIQDGRDPLDESKVVLARVERMVSKFTFTYIDQSTGNPAEHPRAGVVYDPVKGEEDLIYYNGHDEDGVPNYETRKWKMRATGWGINAYEDHEYLFRQFEETEDYFGGWKDPEKWRVYWSVDGHYDDDALPYSWQYRRAIDKMIYGEDVTRYLYYYEELDKLGTRKLTNYSYNDFVNASAGEGFERNVYTPENTYDYNSIYKYLDNRADVLAGTHLIVTAELLSDLDGDNYYEPATVFRDRASVFYKNFQDLFTSQVFALNKFLQSQTNMKFHYYNWDNDEDPLNGTIFYVRPHALPYEGERYQLYYNNELVNFRNATDFLKINGKNVYQRAEVKDGDGKLLFHTDGFTIQLEDGTKMPIYQLKAGLEDTNENLKNDNNFIEFKYAEQGMSYENIVQSIVYEWLGAVDHFNEGKMYYYYPAKINDSLCGTVRNAWYQYTMSKIKKIGTSVDDPNQPIVPIHVPLNSRVLIKIELIDWHRIKTDVPIIGL